MKKYYVFVPFFLEELKTPKKSFRNWLTFSCDDTAWLLVKFLHLRFTTNFYFDFIRKRPRNAFKSAFFWLKLSSWQRRAEKLIWGFGIGGVGEWLVVGKLIPRGKVWIYRSSCDYMTVFTKWTFKVISISLWGEIRPHKCTVSCGKG